MGVQSLASRDRESLIGRKRKVLKDLKQFTCSKPKEDSATKKRKSKKMNGRGWSKKGAKEQLEFQKARG
jgi:hypothetical protein